MKIKKLIAIICSVITLVMCSGCSLNFFSVESLMSPPEQSGKNGEVEAAFKKLMSDQNIQLRTPTSGDYQTSFVLQDINGNGIEEALVFYTDSSIDASVRMAFMECINETWVISADIKGAGSGIYDISFSDLNSDGCYEILVGWSLYDSKTTKIVSIYEATPGDKGVFNLVTLANEYYNTKTLTDFNGDEKDDLLIVYLDDSGEVQKSFFRCFSLSENNELVKFADLMLDSMITDVSKIQFDSVIYKDVFYKRIFLDCLKSDSSMFTEMIYWDSEATKAVRKNKKPSKTTLRSSKIYCRDVDGDGILEIPSTTTLYGDDKLLSIKKADMQYTFTMLKWLNTFGDKSEGNITTLFNPIDLYLYRVTRANDVTVYYDTLAQALRFCIWDNENKVVTDELLSISFRGSGDEFEPAGKELSTTDAGTFYYSITSYGTDFGITDEGVRSSFILIN